MGPVGVSVVRRFLPFAGLDDDQLVAAAAQLRRVTLEAGEILFRQGDHGTSVYLVVGGQVDVRVESEGGEHHLATVATGAVLGELGLLIDEPRSATVGARGHVELWEISRQSFRTGMDSGDAWAGNFLLAAARDMAQRLSAGNGQLVALLGQAGSANPEPPARVAELEELRRRLVSEWAF